MTSASTIIADVRSPIPPFLQNGGECGALLREIDWHHHPLGPPDKWPRQLQTIVSIILGSRQPMYVCWGPDDHTIYNDDYAALCGDRHPKGMATPFAKIWFDIMHLIRDMIAQVKAGKSVHVDQLEVLMHRKGYPEEAHFSFSYTPVRDDHNDVVGLFCACAEITEQVMLRRELQHERGQLAQMFEQAPSLIALMKGADHVFEYVNPASLRLMGHRDVIGKPAREAFPEVMPQGYFEILDSVWATGEPIRIDAAKMSLQLVPGGALEDRFFDLWYEPVRNAAGMITGVFTAGVDVTEHIAAQSALQGSEEFLQSVLGASSDCIKVLDLEGRLVYLSSGGRTAMEVPDGVAIEGTPWPDFWQGPDQGETTKALELARSGSAATFQGYANTALGNRRYWDVHVTPMLDANAQPERILVVSRDITYMKRIEEERELLMNEVAHRLKNAFGMVQSVINQTLRKAESVQEGHLILSGRIRALASAQDILTRSTTSEMLIGEVVEAALLPHRTGEGRFDITGPEAAINGRQSLGLSLALHELATNATKYGALSGETGRVAIGWDIKDNGSFSFHWVESCGPPVTPPGRSGFGSVLIEKIVATYFDGSATLDFLPGGIAFHLRGVITPPDVGEVSDPY